MKRSAVIGSVVVFGLLALVGGALALHRYRAIMASAKEQPFEPPSTVQVVTPTMLAWRPTSDLVGTVIALRSVQLSNEVAGTVREVLFESGQVVDPGHVLVRLDASSEQADLAAANASVQVAEASIPVVEARVRLWEANVRRLTEAVAVRAAADADLDAARANLEEGRAELGRIQAEIAQAKARVAQVQTLLDKKTIRAPFKARAGIRTIHPGQYIAEGTTIVALQGVDDEIYLDFAVPQEQLWRVREGAMVTADAPMLGKDPVQIRVVGIDASVNPTTRNVRIRAVVPDPSGSLRPGMFVDVRVPLEESREYLAVPIAAVRRASFGDHVFVIAKAEDGALRARQRFVTLGPTIEAPGADGTLHTWSIILKGLEDGEQLAADGSFKLREGALVVIGGEPGGTQPGGPPAQTAGK